MRSGLQKVIASEEVKDVEEIEVIRPAIEATGILGVDTTATVVVPQDRADIPEVEV